MENQLELCFHEEPPNCNLDEVFQQVIKLQKYNVWFSTAAISEACLAGSCEGEKCEHE